MAFLVRARGRVQSRLLYCYSFIDCFIAARKKKTESGLVKLPDSEHQWTPRRRHGYEHKPLFSRWVPGAPICHSEMDQSARQCISSHSMPNSSSPHMSDHLERAHCKIYVLKRLLCIFLWLICFITNTIKKKVFQNIINA